MTKKCASRDKIVIFGPILYVNKAHHSPLSLRSIKQRIIARKTEWCNPFFAHQRAQLTMEWAHCKRKHEVKMTETHELNRPVICLRYAARGVTHPVKSPRTASDYRFRRPAPLTLSTARRGCAQTVNWRRIRVIFESDRTPSGALCTTKSSWKEPLRLSTISSGASVIGELANSVV